MIAFPDPGSHLRTESFGEGYYPTLVDRFGTWLSARQIHCHVPDFRAKRIGDFGCGYHATFVRSVLDCVASATLVDVSISPDLAAHPKVTALTGSMVDMLTEIPTATLHVILCISVLEHLWDPGIPYANLGGSWHPAASVF